MVCLHRVRIFLSSAEWDRILSLLLPSFLSRLQLCLLILAGASIGPSIAAYIRLLHPGWQEVAIDSCRLLPRSWIPVADQTGIQIVLEEGTGNIVVGEELGLYNLPFLASNEVMNNHLEVF